MPGPPAFQFYASDFVRGTTFLSVAAVGAYIRMLSESWNHGPIPDHPAAIQKAMGLMLTDPPMEALWTELQPKWKLTERGWVNPRLEKIRADQERYRERCRKAGLISGRMRKGLGTGVQRSFNVRSTDVEPTHELKGNTLISDLQSQSKIKNKIKTVCVEPKIGSPPSPAFLTFPTTGRGPKTWILTEAHTTELAESYPGLDVFAEARKALAWCRANPTRRKTAGGMPKFLVSWLNTSTDRPRTALAPITATNGQGRGAQAVDVFDRASEAIERVYDRRENRTQPEGQRLEVTSDSQAGQAGPGNSSRLSARPAKLPG